MESKNSTQVVHSVIQCILREEIYMLPYEPDFIRWYNYDDYEIL